MVVIVWSIYTNSGNAAKVGNKGIVSNVLKVRESIVSNSGNVGNSGS